MAELYEDLDDLEERAQEPEDANLGAAAIFLRNMFQSNRITFAIMGGYSLVLRGNDRKTNDIDVAADATMRELYNLTSQQPRLMIPKSKIAAANVLRVFLMTGPKWDSTTKRDHLIKIDIQVPGEGRGVPNPVYTSVELVRSQNQSSGTSTTQFPVLSIPFILRAKLGAYRGRESDNDYQDILFILQNFESVVKQPSTHERLDPEDTIFFLEACPSRFKMHFTKTLGMA